MGKKGKKRPCSEEVRLFNEKMSSKLNKLYDSFDSIISKNATIRLSEDRKPITYNDLQMAMKTHPFVMTKEKNQRLELDSITYNDVNTIISAMKSLPSQNSVTIEMVQIEKFPNVLYVPSRISSPRMTIDLSKENILPRYQGVRVNTGYAIRIPLDSQDVVVIPTIVSNHPGLIPALYARDAEDKGLLTINFTTTLSIDLSKKIKVEFEAYHSIRPPMSTDDKDKVFKFKDYTSPDRFVANTILKFYANNFDTKKMDGTLLLKTFDPTKNPIEPNENQNIELPNGIVLFTSRKREWCNPELVTLSGIYNSVEPSNTVTPIVAVGSTFNDNTHCLSFIQCRVSLFSVNGHMGSDIRMINGSFSNLENYREIMKKTRDLVNSLHALCEGAQKVQQFNRANNTLDEMKFMKLYDYYRGNVTLNDGDLAKKINYDDKKMFDTRPDDLLPYSVKLYKSFKYLTEQFSSLLSSPSTST